LIFAWKRICIQINCDGVKPMTKSIPLYLFL
jgi:hypothetical protein